MNLQSCTKHSFIRFCDHLSIFLMVKVACISSETQDCPLCKETFRHLNYICMNTPPGLYHLPGACTPLAGRTLQGLFPCHEAGSKAMDIFSAPPSLHSAERSESNQSVLSVDLWGLPGSRTAAGTRVRHSSEFHVQGKCQYFRRSCELGFVCLCLF